MMRLFVAALLLVLVSRPCFAEFTAAEAASRRGDHAAAYEACKADLEKDAECQNLVGVLFQKGLGVPVNLKESLRLFQLAAVKKLPAAQTNLGAMYANGVGVEKDDNLAARWFAVAASEGDPIGEYDFAQMLLAGRGVEKDPERAGTLLKHGADRGFVPSQILLAIYYEIGRNRRPNYAYMWYRIAARRTHDAAQRRVADEGENRTILSLNGQEIVVFRTAADEWKPVGPALEFGLFGARPVATEHAAADPSKPTSSGSGFVVSHAGDVITNNHVVDGCREMKIVRDGKAVVAKVIGTDPAGDLALLRMPVAAASATPAAATAPAGANPAAAVADDVASFRQDLPPKPGEPVVVVGYPLQGLLSSDASVTSGIVSATAGLHNDKKQLQITAPVQPGNSGGPLVDAGGRVVGIVVGKINGIRVAEITGAIPENINFAVNAQLARDLLDKNNVKYESVPAGEPMPTAAVADRALKFTVLVQCFK